MGSPYRIARLDGNYTPHRTCGKAGILSMTSVGIGMSADERVSSWRCSAIGVVKAGRCGRDENSNPLGTHRCITRAEVEKTPSQRSAIRRSGSEPHPARDRPVFTECLLTVGEISQGDNEVMARVDPQNGFGNGRQLTRSRQEPLQLPVHAGLRCHEALGMVSPRMPLSVPVPPSSAGQF
jgi:hypothetical protein